MSEEGVASEDRSTTEHTDEVVTWVRGERLTLTLHHEADRLLIEASGELDVASAPVLAGAVPPAETSPTVVIDLSRLAFLDASGLRQLLVLADEGRRVALQDPPRLVQRVLEVTGAVERFEVEYS